MNRILALTLILAAMSAGAGCEPMWLRSGSDKEPSQTPQQKQIEQLQGEVAAMKDQIDIRNSQQKELQSRADALAKKLRELDFTNQQQANQIKVLSQAPLARDEYKTLAEQLKISLERVTVRLAQLEASNKVLTLKVKMATRDKADSTVVPTTGPAIDLPTAPPAIVLPTAPPATVLPTTAPAIVLPTTPPAMVMPTPKTRRSETAPAIVVPTTGPVMVMPTTAPATTEPAPGEEF